MVIRTIRFETSYTGPFGYVASTQNVSLIAKCQDKVIAMYVDAQKVSALLANISNEISSRLIRMAVNKVWQVSAQRDEHSGELLLLKMRSVLAT